MIPQRYAAALAAWALLLAGCSSGDDADRADHSYAEGTPTSDTVELPDGMRWVDTASGLRFAAPARSTVITGDAVDAPANAPALADLLALLGLTTNGSVVRAELRRGDVLVAGPKRRYTWVTGEDADAFPTEEELKSTTDYHGTYAEIDTIYSALGAGTIAYRPVRLDGRITFTASVFVRVAGGTAFVLVTAATYDDLALTVSDLVATFSEAG